MKCFFAFLLSVVIFSFPYLEVNATEQITAKTFADMYGNLDLQRASFYVAYRDKVPLSKFIPVGQLTLEPEKVFAVMQDKVDDLRSKTGHPAPWSWMELDKAYPPEKTDAQIEDNLPKGQKIEGLTTKMKKGNFIFGPVALRKTAKDLSSELSDASGATLAYSKDFQKSGSGALASEGILYYPVNWNMYQGGKGRSGELSLNFATQWNVAQVQEDRSKDVEELTFSLPLTLYLSPGVGISDRDSKHDAARSQLWLLQGKPYFQTDFGFNYKIHGVEGSIEYVGNICRLKSPCFRRFSECLAVGYAIPASSVPHNRLQRDR